MVGPIPLIGDNAAGVGTTNTAPEIDGVVRRMPLLMKIGNDVYPNIAIEVIRVAVGDPSYQVKADASGIVAMRVPGYATINTDANARVWLRWNKEFNNYLQNKYPQWETISTFSKTSAFKLTFIKLEA